MTTPNTSMPIPVSKVIVNPNQPRKMFNEQSIQELAASIADPETGLLQPILVEDNHDGTYTLVGGERRLRAHQLLGRTSIEAIVRERSNHGGRELLLHALVENVQREDMNPMDEAEAYQRLHIEFDMTEAQIAVRVGKGQASINHRMILTKLNPEIRELVRLGQLTPLSNVARALLRIPDSQARIRTARKIAEGGLTVKQAEALADKIALTLGATKIEVGDAKSPVMRLAQRKARKDDFDEERAPSGWNALQQAGQVPPWPVVTRSVTRACQKCALAAMANEITCGECPLVDFLVDLLAKLTGA